MKYDREWAIIDSNGNSVSQKRYPQLCLMKLKIDLNSKYLLITAPEMEDLSISLDHQINEVITMKVCGKKTLGKMEASQNSQWFSRYLGIECTLVRR